MAGWASKEWLQVPEALSGAGPVPCRPLSNVISPRYGGAKATASWLAMRFEIPGLLLGLTDACINSCAGLHKACRASREAKTGTD